MGHAVGICLRLRRYEDDQYLLPTVYIGTRCCGLPGFYFEYGT